MARVLTPALTDRVVESGQIVTVVDVFDAESGDLLLTSDPDNVRDPRIKIVSGSVTTDEVREIVGTAEATILVDAEVALAILPLLELSGFSPVAPVRVQVGFRAPGDDEVMPYGAYEIDVADVSETQEGVVVSTILSDNSRRVRRARFWRPETVGKNTPYPTAFRTLLDPVLPEVNIEIGSTNARTGKLTFQTQDDRLAEVTKMATAIGFRFDWNADGIGNVEIVDDTDLSDDPVWEFMDGGNARVTRVKRGLTDENTFNGVIAMGEATGSDRPPVRGEAWDRDASSPTFFDPNDPESSFYGPVPFFFVSEFITTKLQAVIAARARLPKVIGLRETLEIEALPHPGITPSDPILVNRPQIGVEKIFIVEAVELPLSAGRMRIRCRDRRVII